MSWVGFGYETISYSLCGLCLSLSRHNPQTVKLFYVSLCFQALYQQYTVLSFSSIRRHYHSHKLTSSHALWYYTSWAYLSQMHRPNLWVGILFWTSRKRQWQTSKFNRKAIPRAQTHMITHLQLRTCYREVYGNIACEENGWFSHSKFITLLTFELSSFRESDFFFLMLFPRCSHWYLSLDA